VPPAPDTRVWDLPTRVFHWALTLLVLFSFVTAKIGGYWTDWHFRSGYSILTLLIFRIAWGFAGSAYARFSSFVRGPAAIVAYLRAPAWSVAGHTPLGGAAIVVMLAALLLQAATGLFANDAIASEGPLARFVSAALSDRLTTVHRWNEKALIGLIALHLGAIAYYRWARGLDLVTPMFTGDARVRGAPARDDTALRVRALVLFALVVAVVAYVVNL
jgi:cytochrome b